MRSKRLLLTCLPVDTLVAAQSVALRRRVVAGYRIRLGFLVHRDRLSLLLAQLITKQTQFNLNLRLTFRISCFSPPRSRKFIFAHAALIATESGLRSTKDWIAIAYEAMDGSKSFLADFNSQLYNGAGVTDSALVGPSGC